MCAVSSQPTTLPTLSCGFRHADHGDDHDHDLDHGVGNHEGQVHYQGGTLIVKQD